MVEGNRHLVTKAVGAILDLAGIDPTTFLWTTDGDGNLIDLYICVPREEEGHWERKR